MTWNASVPDAITNTSPLLYLFRLGAVDWLPRLFSSVWAPTSVVNELEEGHRQGYEVPAPSVYAWLQVTDPGSTPSEWLALDLGAGELAAMALALEYPTRIVLLDDLFARRTAEAAGLKVWGTLRILLQAKAQGLTDRVEPLVDRLAESGMWLSEEIRQRILSLAGEVSAP